MCAILGMIVNAKSNIDRVKVKSIFDRLLVESSIRGTHATGLIANDGREINVLKKAVKAKDFITESAYGTMIDSICKKDNFMLMGHCRQQTKGPSSNINNVHPIIAETIVGAHNGIIGNDDELFKKFNLKRIAEVDSEIIFALLNLFSKEDNKTSTAITRTSNALEGSFACSFVDVNSPDILWLFRGSMPIVLRYYVDTKIWMYGSTEQILDGVNVEKQFFTLNIPPSSMLGINMKNYNYKKNSIKI